MSNILNDLIKQIGAELFVDNYYDFKAVADGYLEASDLDSVILPKLNVADDLSSALQKTRNIVNCIKNIFDEGYNISILDIIISTATLKNLKKNAEKIRNDEIMIGLKTNKIKFSDYFSISQPRYKNISELDRNNAYYLTPPLLSDEIGNYINNPLINNIPKKLIDDILVVEMQKYDTMIDKDGNKYDWSDGFDAFSPTNKNVKINDNWFEKRLSAVNHIVFDDVLDVESSVIYNLFEIRTKTSDVSIDYLRYYFRPIQQPVEYYSQMTSGRIFLKILSDKFNNEICSDQYYYDCELFNSSTLVIDKFDSHTILIENHKKFLSEQSRGVGRLAIQAEFGNSLYHNLTILENQVQAFLNIHGLLKDRGSYCGFVSMLEECIMVFNTAQEKGQTDISTASIFGFPLACEVILRSKLKINIANLNINKDTMLGNMIDCLYKQRENVFKKRLFSDNLKTKISMVAYKRNSYAHSGNRIDIMDAKKDIQLFCSTIRLIDELLV